MKGVFKEQRMSRDEGAYLVNRIITDWFFILCGRGNEGDARRGEDADEGGPRFDAATVTRLLLEHIVCAALAPQQAALVSHWREENRAMLRALSNKPYGSPAWEELAWKRNHLVELITSYEQIRGGADVVR
jgi:hypothetical protein